MADDRALQTAIDEWSTRLAGLSGEQIKNGLARLKSGWPPDPIAFRELCLNEDDPEHRTAAYKEFRRDRAIERKADPEVAKAELEKARQLLRGVK